MNDQRFSIQNYHDVIPIYDKLDKLIHQPIVPIPREAMDTYISWMYNNCSKSKQMTDMARQYIPGGVQHNLAFNYPFPIVINRAEGPYLYDVDGNRYIDFLQAGGPTVLGNNPPEIREKVFNLLEQCGPSTGLFNEYEMNHARFICQHIPSVERFRMLNSGSESVIAACRVARIATRKKKIIKIGGAYHGWMDSMMYGTRIPGTRGFEAKGIPIAYYWHTQEVAPNDLKALEKILMLNKMRGGTAAVILEPLGPESGTRPVPYDYNKNVRALCDAYGALLIFDEVVTAFRVGIGGAQSFFNVLPDLTVFGKVVAGGYPSAGGLGGRKELMRHIDSGLDDEQDKKVKKVKVGGTMAANPLSCVAGYYTLKAIEEKNACAKAGKAGDRLTESLNSLIDKYGLPYVAYNQGSICHLETSGVLFVKINWLKISKVLKELNIRKKMLQEMGAAYLAEGIVTLAGSRMYTSMANTENVIDDALNRFENVFKKIAVSR
jgi:glutamate-1-semialdehyde 2,1-aminomutase